MTGTEAATANPTNDWRGDLQRGFREALKVANDAVRVGEQVRSPGNLARTSAADARPLSP